MKASEHLALCEGKRGGATAEERALCAELEAAEKALIEADKPCLAWIARAEAAEKDVRILTEASRANEDMIERARGSVPVEKLEKLANEIESALQWGNGDTVHRIRALLAEAREGGKPPHPQIIRYETTLDGVHVTVRRDALEWLENQITLSPPSSAGTEGLGLMEILRKWQVAFDHFLADPGQFLDVFKEPIRLTQLALAARPVEGEKK